jgi:hypothetical protein
VASFFLSRERFSFQPLFAWALIAVMFCAFVSLFLSFQAGVFLLLFVITAWWTWEHPEEGFLLFIVLAPLLPMLKITGTIGTATLIKDVIIAALLLKLFLVPLLQQHLPYRRNVLFAPLVGLLALTAWAALRSDALLLGILRARDIVLYMLLFMAVLYLQQGARRDRTRLAWFALSSAAVLALGAYQWFFAVDSAVLRFDPARLIWIPRISSVMAHPSIFGEYAVMAAALAGAVALRAASKRARILGAGFFVVLMPYIFLTYSRAVWIGLAAATGAAGLALLVRQAQTRRAWSVLKKYGAVAVMLLVVGGILLGRFTSTGVFVRSAFDPTYGSNQERLEFMARLIAPLSNAEALVGKGLGDVLAQNFREVDLTVYDIAAGAARDVQLAKNRTLVDNQYLKTFVEMGLAGLVVYGWLYWRFGRAAWRLATDRAATARQQIIGLWGLGFLVAFVVQAFFIDIWDIFPTNAAFWIVAALVSANAVVRVGRKQE